jgi:hypothetical protein
LLGIISSISGSGDLGVAEVGVVGPGTGRVVADLVHQELDLLFRSRSCRGRGRHRDHLDDVVEDGVAKLAARRERCIAPVLSPQVRTDVPLSYLPIILRARLSLARWALSR